MGCKHLCLHSLKPQQLSQSHVNTHSLKPQHLGSLKLQQIYQSQVNMHSLEPQHVSTHSLKPQHLGSLKPQPPQQGNMHSLKPQHVNTHSLKLGTLKPQHLGRLKPQHLSRSVSMHSLKPQPNPSPWKLKVRWSLHLCPSSCHLRLHPSPLQQLNPKQSLLQWQPKPQQELKLNFNPVTAQGMQAFWNVMRRKSTDDLSMSSTPAKVVLPPCPVPQILPCEIVAAMGETEPQPPVSLPQPVTPPVPPTPAPTVLETPATSTPTPAPNTAVQPGQHSVHQPYGSSSKHHPCTSTKHSSAARPALWTTSCGRSGILHEVLQKWSLF